jgi:hypothetical protein
MRQSSRVARDIRSIDVDERFSDQPRELGDEAVASGFRDLGRTPSP